MFDKSLFQAVKDLYLQTNYLKTMIYCLNLFLALVNYDPLWNKFKKLIFNTVLIKEYTLNNDQKLIKDFKYFEEL